MKAPMLAVALLAGFVFAISTLSNPLASSDSVGLQNYNSSAISIKLVARTDVPWYDENNLPSQAQWNACGIQGTRYDCLLYMTDAAAGRATGQVSGTVASEWKVNTYNTLKLWGWQEMRFKWKKYCTFHPDSSDKIFFIWRAIRALGLDEYPEQPRGFQIGKNYCHMVQHIGFKSAVEDPYDFSRPPYEGKYVVDRREYAYTGAYYRFGINQKQGALFLMGWASVEDSVKKYWPENVDQAQGLPACRYSADIWAAYWLRDHWAPTNLQHIFMTTVFDSETLKVIAKILKSRSLSADSLFWPGYQADVISTQADGRALLGTPSGKAVVYFLMRYKKELGIKRVSKIHIFRDDQPADSVPLIQLYFEIYSVPLGMDDFPPPPGPVNNPAARQDPAVNPSAGMHHVRGRRDIVRVHNV